MNGTSWQYLGVAVIAFGTIGLLLGASLPFWLALLLNYAAGVIVYLYGHRLSRKVAREFRQGRRIEVPLRPVCSVCLRQFWPDDVQ